MSCLNLRQLYIRKFLGLALVAFPLITQLSGQTNKVKQPDQQTQLNQLLQSLYIPPEKVQKPAVSFSLRSMDGKQISLQQASGKILFLHFWATWCGPCRDELPKIEAFYRQLDPNKFALLAISSDEGGKDAVQRFISGRDYKMPILLDQDGQVSSSYAVQALPTTFFVSPNGKILAEVNGARDWTHPSMTQLINLLAETVDIEKGFLLAASEVKAGAGEVKKKLTQEDINRILPKIEVTVKTDKPIYHLNDKIILSIIFRWKELERNAFFIRPPKLPEGIQKQKILMDSFSSSRAGTRELEYRIRLVAKTIGEIKADPLSFEYILFGYDQPVKSRHPGIIIPVKEIQWLGLSRVVWALTLLSLTALILVLAVFLRKKKNKKQRSKVISQENALGFSQLKEVYRTLRESKLKRNSLAFMQALSNLRNINISLLQAEQLSFLEELNEGKKEQVEYGGGEFTEAEYTYFVSKTERIVAALEKQFQDE